MHSRARVATTMWLRIRKSKSKLRLSLVETWLSPYKSGPRNSRALEAIKITIESLVPLWWC
jgi:hypothetical protein